MMQHHPGEPRAPQVNGSLPSLSSSRPILTIDAPLLHSGMSRHSALSGSRQLSVVDTHVPPINSALSDSGQENNRASTSQWFLTEKLLVDCMTNWVSRFPSRSEPAAR